MRPNSVGASWDIGIVAPSNTDAPALGRCLVEPFAPMGRLQSFRIRSIRRSRRARRDRQANIVIGACHGTPMWLRCR
jgi:hypothetical protein